LTYWLLCRSEPHVVRTRSPASPDGGEVMAVSSINHEP
jgi:hypothetical protein